MVVLGTLCAGEVGALEALAGPSGAQLALVGGVQVVAGSAGTAGAVGSKVQGGIAGSTDGAGLTTGASGEIDSALDAVSLGGAHRILGVPFVALRAVGGIRASITVVDRLPALETSVDIPSDKIVP